MNCQIRSRNSLVYSVIFTSFLISSCASMKTKELRKVDDQALLEQVRSAGKGVESVEGTVWLKATSQEVNGQYPASVRVVQPDLLKMAVNNFLGGTEALISASGDEFNIVSGVGEKQVHRRKVGAWGGIPLRWASQLFLGKIPMPEVKFDQMTVLRTSPNEIEVRVQISPERQEIYRYQFDYEMDKQEPIPVALRWELLQQELAKLDAAETQVEIRTETSESKLQDDEVKKVSIEDETDKASEEKKDETSNTAATKAEEPSEKELAWVEFDFSKQEDSTGSPTKWEARSEKGSIKVVWKERVTNESSKN